MTLIYPAIVESSNAPCSDTPISSAADASALCSAYQMRNIGFCSAISTSDARKVATMRRIFLVILLL